MNTMTGRLLVSGADVQTFTARQSSDCTELLFSVGSLPTSCGQAGARSRAGRTSVHGLGSTGGRNRSGPLGEFAKRMPRNTSTPASESPRTGPELVTTTTPPVPVEVTARLEGQSARAATNPAASRTSEWPVAPRFELCATIGSV